MTGVWCDWAVTGVVAAGDRGRGWCDWPGTGEFVVAGVFEDCGIGDCFAWGVAIMLDSNFNLTRICGQFPCLFSCGLRLGLVGYLRLVGLLYWQRTVF